MTEAEKRKYKEAYQKATEALEELYRLTDEDNPYITETWRIKLILDPMYRAEMKE